MSSIELTGAVNCAAQMSPRSKTPVRVTMTPVSTALFLMATMPVFGTRMDALQVCAGPVIRTRSAASMTLDPSPLGMKARNAARSRGSATKYAWTVAAVVFGMELPSVPRLSCSTRPLKLKPSALLAPVCWTILTWRLARRAMSPSAPLPRPNTRASSRRTLSTAQRIMGAVPPMVPAPMTSITRLAES